MTFSLLGRDDTGRVGLAVASCVLAIGSRACHLLPNVGIAVVQGGAWSEDVDALRQALGDGLSADEAIATARDLGREMAQYAVMPLTEGPAAWTSNDCDEYSGQIVGQDFSAQGNLLTGPEVLRSAVECWSQGKDQPLEERLILAMQAGVTAGGDVRGQQSAALLTCGAGPAADVVDLRVDDSPAPMEELLRLVQMHRAHEQLRSAWSLAPRDLQAAAEAVSRAQALAPDDALIAPCAAVLLTESGDAAAANRALATAREHVPALELRLARMSERLPWFTPQAYRRLVGELRRS